jgi:hypothetical protein
MYTRGHFSRLQGLSAVLFVYLPLRDGGAGFMGRVRINALVFVPLAIVTGAAFVMGGPRVLDAFQARPKSRRQLALVLGIIIGSGVLTGLAYWQIKTRWMTQEESRIIRDRTKWAPALPN